MSALGPFGLSVDDPTLEASLRAGLSSVEELLHEAVKSDYPFVSETARHLVEAGGKSVKEGVSKAEAEDIKKKLEAAGAKVELK